MVNERHARMVWIPWLCLPLLLLLDLRLFVASFSLDLALLQIPIAILLASRFGRHGFVVATLACAPLLIGVDLSLALGVGELDSRPVIFVVAIHAAWLTLHQRWPPQAPDGARGALRLSIPLLLVTATSVGLWLGTFDLRWWGLPLLYYAFFLLGLRGSDGRRWLVIAGLATLAGAVVQLYARYTDAFQPYLDLGGIVSVSWSLDRLSEYLTLLAFYFIGGWVRAAAQAPDGSPAARPRRSRMALGVAVLVVGAPLWRALTDLVAELGQLAYLDDLLRIIAPVGSYYLLPGLALFLGAAWRRGVWLAISVVAVMYLLEVGAAAIWELRLRTDLELLPVAIGFALLGARAVRGVGAVDGAAADRSRQAPAARTAWLVPLYPGEQTVTDLTAWKREHDEISNTVRRVMLTLLAYALFCALALAAPDVSLVGVSSEIRLPIANTSVDYSAFLTVGPLILVGLVVYLHVFLQSAIDLGRPEDARPLPYLFNMENRLAAALSGFMLYWVPVLLLFVFAWKAAPQPGVGYGLGLAAAAMGAAMAYVRLARYPPDCAPGRPRFMRVVLVAFVLLFVLQLFSGGALRSRPLRLYNADLSEQYLRKWDLNEAWMAKANLTGANLAEADLRGADLSGARLDGKSDLSAARLRDADLEGARMRDANLSQADLRGADLSDAQLDGASLTRANLQGAILVGAGLRNTDLDRACLRGVSGLDCERLTSAKGWESAFRDPELACDGPVPELPKVAPVRQLPRDDRAMQSSVLRGEAGSGEAPSRPAEPLPWLFGDCR